MFPDCLHLASSRDDLAASRDKEAARVMDVRTCMEAYTDLTHREGQVSYNTSFNKKLDDDPDLCSTLNDLDDKKNTYKWLIEQRERLKEKAREVDQLFGKQEGKIREVRHRLYCVAGLAVFGTLIIKMEPNSMWTTVFQVVICIGSLCVAVHERYWQDAHNDDVFQLGTLFLLIYSTIAWIYSSIYSTIAGNSSYQFIFFCASIGWSVALGLFDCCCGRTKVSDNPNITNTKEGGVGTQFTVPTVAQKTVDLSEISKAAAYIESGSEARPETVRN